MHPEFVKKAVHQLDAMITKSKAIKDPPRFYWGPWGKFGFDWDLDEQFKNLIRELMKRSGCEKTHSWTLVFRAMTDFYGRLANRMVGDPVKELSDLFASYEDYTEIHSAYLILDGVRVYQDLNLGGVDIFYCNGEKFDEMLRLGQFESDKDDEKSKAQLESYVTKLRSQFVEKTLMRYKACAEPFKVNELAIEQCRRVIDLLRYAARSIEHKSYRIGFEGENKGTDNFILSKSFIGNFPNTPKDFRLDGEAYELMRGIGVFPLSELLLKPVSSLTEIEDSLLNAVRWFASAVNQVEENVSFLHFVICLESLFTSIDKSIPIASTISDSVAFLCADTKSQRVKIKREVKDLYDLRSSIAHGGKHAVAAPRLDRVAIAAQASIRKIIDHKDSLITKVDLARYIDELKYFGRDDLIGGLAESHD
jgi:hypothetical protein